ncbi:DNA-3-methyladenine glycosylase [Anoxybacillus sp. LAT_35]|uniref:DNA-3-methyladenine glycosylase family protein n=1 Tax=unclassified Anoxybacillus TaxID=2639704 RepID=UPI001EDAA41D|nr:MULTISPECIES: DNA-3-methyladenine glycosylase [unclassified Anoxybacillus]MCG5026262.1 DNA-3-methyladenine glycosylase [Anoxybacillus flavithermus]MCG6196565.1 DNA-3-methyladenine glycosylase [Anoxybacillus sp. LAT_38]MCG3084261.1 DNA-3-methyladenine glycosylase [Anoxybacillus sp. LAT27]MCG6172314.1 DNA-3-methyladenine glycosylase [Anoxybacillus sp. LAT_11]MCG6175978.1 DNA-3-methyladenine glycosylase [Anoxybacillus sp. LAT_31]
MWQQRIEVEAPYDFSRVLERLAQDPLSAVDIEKQQLVMPFYINETPVAVSVRSIGTKQEPVFLVEAPYEQLKEVILSRLFHILHWDRSLLPIHKHFLQTELRGIFLEHEGTPLVLESDLYFCLIKCIIHQQLHMKVAYKMTERFVKTFGQEIDGVWFYPRPEQIARLSYDELKALQFSGKKAEYMIDISRLIVEGKLDLERLVDATDEEVMKTLLAIRGIGPWTVQNFLLFGLGRPNLFPKADIGLQRAVQKLLSLEMKPSLAQMEALSKRWEPYLSYASLYLWRSIE